MQKRQSNYSFDFVKYGMKARKYKSCIKKNYNIFNTRIRNAVRKFTV